MKKIVGVIKAYNKVNLIIRIIIGIIIGAIFGIFVPQAGFLATLGDLFVGALKAIAPVLVFTLVISSLSSGTAKLDKRFGLVIFFYMISTLFAAIVSAFLSFIMPVKLNLTEAVETAVVPKGIGEVLHNLLMNMVSNPVAAVSSGNYTGILTWAVILGLAFKKITNESTKVFISDISNVISIAVKWIISLAPFGILGLVFKTVSEEGLDIFKTYGKLLILLVGSMLIVALVIDPLIALIFLKRNPYPLVLRCLKNSGITAFFTRSSAANIPVNMELCEKLGLDRDMYSVCIPLGATINMDGAAVTITVMTLAAANTVGANVDVFTAIILSFLAALAACGASGVAGGSLLLIPMACSLFGIPVDVAMQVVGVGFVIGVVQDSVETMLNSSGDVMFAATAEYYSKIRDGKEDELPVFLGGKYIMK